MREAPDPARAPESVGLHGSRVGAGMMGHFPVFISIIVDLLDHLWIREYDLPREERSAPLWTVFDPDGHALVRAGICRNARRTSDLRDWRGLHPGPLDG